MDDFVGGERLDISIRNAVSTAFSVRTSFVNLVRRSKLEHLALLVNDRTLCSIHIMHGARGLSIEFSGLLDFSQRVLITRSGSRTFEIISK